MASFRQLSGCVWDSRAALLTRQRKRLAYPTAIVEHRRQLVFLFLILAQGAHSIEKYVTRLYEVFAPARFVSSLVNNDLALGFLVTNGVLVTFGLWSSSGNSHAFANGTI
jgi:hypothetical protein